MPGKDHRKPPFPLHTGRNQKAKDFEIPDDLAGDTPEERLESARKFLREKGCDLVRDGRPYTDWPRRQGE